MPRVAFTSPAKRVIKSIPKTKNVMVDLPSSNRAVSLDEMEAHLEEVGTDIGIYISHITVLGRKRYPGNRHWHFKQSPKEPGCLDVTYWPSGSLLWISVRNCEPSWVHSTGRELQKRMEKQLASLE